MSRHLEPDHPAVKAVIEAIQRSCNINRDKKAVTVTGVLESDANGMINATNSEAPVRTALSIGWAGELHVAFAYPDEEAQEQSV